MPTKKDIIPAAPTDRGQLSIVMQGGLSAGNLVETATYCRHWRSIFPDAEIILSLSGTDVIRGECHDGLVANPRLALRLRPDSQLRAALEVITEVCDKLALRSDGLPLPPIKTDTPKPNNINLQIAAAQNGLRHATGEYVLRVRSDFIFLNKNFIDQYETMAALPRGGRSMLSKRVMISWLYTLNPYTYERLPMHFSDWFNYGKLADVRALWDVPFVEFADAVHYQVNPHPSSSNAAERLFNIRVADEQHLILHAMQKYIPDLNLDTLIDDRLTTLGMDLLADNFCLCDLKAANAYFPKYQSDFENAEKIAHCLTPDDWFLIVQNRGVNYKTTLAHKILLSEDRKQSERSEGFPRTYKANRLFSKVGRHLNGEIVAAKATGTVVYGPHVSIPAGRYHGKVTLSAIEGRGTIVLHATLEHGRTSLASRRIEIKPGKDVDLSLEFEITDPRASDFEIVVDIDGIQTIAVISVTISEIANNLSTPLPYYSFNEIQTMRPLLNLHPHNVGDEDARWQKVGEISALRPGNYCASLNILSFHGTGQLHVGFSTNGGKTLHVRRTFEIGETDERVHLDIPATVMGRDSQNLEIFYYIDGALNLEIGGVLFTQRKLDSSSDFSDYFFTASTLPTRVGRLEGDRIVSKRASGVLSYGPYIFLPSGEYSAKPIFSKLDGRGTVTIIATADNASKNLAKVVQKCRSTGQEIPAVHFLIPESGAKNVELTCAIKGFEDVELDGILLCREHAS